jgi:hypothetical protein
MKLKGSRGFYKFSIIYTKNKVICFKSFKIMLKYVRTNILRK